MRRARDQNGPTPGGGRCARGDSQEPEASLSSDIGGAVGLPERSKPRLITQKVRILPPKQVQSPRGRPVSCSQERIWYSPRVRGDEQDVAVE